MFPKASLLFCLDITRNKNVNFLCRSISPESRTKRMSLPSLLGLPGWPPPLHLRLPPPWGHCSASSRLRQRSQRWERPVPFWTQSWKSWCTKVRYLWLSCCTCVWRRHRDSLCNLLERECILIVNSGGQKIIFILLYIKLKNWLVAEWPWSKLLENFSVCYYGFSFECLSRGLCSCVCHSPYHSLLYYTWPSHI